MGSWIQGMSRQSGRANSIVEMTSKQVKNTPQPTHGFLILRRALLETTFEREGFDPDAGRWGFSSSSDKNGGGATAIAWVWVWIFAASASACLNSAAV
jgi:hypothetical protein